MAIASQPSSTLETWDCDIFFSICLVIRLPKSLILLAEKKNCVFIHYYSLVVRIYFIIQRLLADFVMIIEYCNIMFFTFNFRDKRLIIHFRHVLDFFFTIIIINLPLKLCFQFLLQLKIPIKIIKIAFKCLKL